MYSLGQLVHKPVPSTATKPMRQQASLPRPMSGGGKFIGKDLEVYQTLGEGGFGIVYLVYSHETGDVYALKTFQDWFLGDEKIKARFQREAGIWVELGHHPYLVHAEFVEKIAGRLYIALEYVPSDEEGLNTLQGYLEQHPPELQQSLRWAIQICFGMEYAFSMGLRAHRDLKPANIMITQDRTAKVTDFGLAGWESEVLAAGEAVRGSDPSAINPTALTTIGRGFGTPTHMAPEQFENAAACDERSDIYSFGIILYQMLVGGAPPFLAPWNPNFIPAMRRMHMSASVPPLRSPLFPVILRCMEKSPENRYQTFNEIREELETLLQAQNGEVVIPPQLQEAEAVEWIYKGISLYHLDRKEEAIRCYDRGLELDPRSAIAWLNKGNASFALGHSKDALDCYNNALELDQHHTHALHGKGRALARLGRQEEAVRCYDQVLKLDPRDIQTWYDKGILVYEMGDIESAIPCFDKVIEHKPAYAPAYYAKGQALIQGHHHWAALPCFEKVVELDPQHVESWFRLGWIQVQGPYDDQRFRKALHYFEKVLSLNPQHADAWAFKGNCLDQLDLTRQAMINPDGVRGSDPLYGTESMRCFSKALEIDPRNLRALSWMSSILHEKKRDGEAVALYDRALKLAPDDIRLLGAKAWTLLYAGRFDAAREYANKALQLDSQAEKALWTLAEVERRTGSPAAAGAWRRFLAVLEASPEENKQLIEFANMTLRQLEQKK